MSKKHNKEIFKLVYNQVISNSKAIFCIYGTSIENFLIIENEIK
jgi:hypothetical protein